MPESWESRTDTNLQSLNMLEIPIIFTCVAPVCPLETVRRKKNRVEKQIYVEEIQLFPKSILKASLTYQTFRIECNECGEIRALFHWFIFSFNFEYVKFAIFSGFLSSPTIKKSINTNKHKTFWFKCFFNFKPIIKKYHFISIFLLERSALFESFIWVVLSFNHHHHL